MASITSRGEQRGDIRGGAGVAAEASPSTGSVPAAASTNHALPRPNVLRGRGPRRHLPRGRRRHARLHHGRPRRGLLRPGPAPGSGPRSGRSCRKNFGGSRKISATVSV